MRDQADLVSGMIKSSIGCIYLLRRTGLQKRLFVPYITLISIRNFRYVHYKRFFSTILFLALFRLRAADKERLLGAAFSINQNRLHLKHKRRRAAQNPEHGCAFSSIRNQYSEISIHSKSKSTNLFEPPNPNCCFSLIAIDFSLILPTQPRTIAFTGKQKKLYSIAPVPAWVVHQIHHSFPTFCH